MVKSIILYSCYGGDFVPVFHVCILVSFRNMDAGMIVLSSTCSRFESGEAEATANTIKNLKIFAGKGTVKWKGVRCAVCGVGNCIKDALRITAMAKTK